MSRRPYSSTRAGRPARAARPGAGRLTRQRARRAALGAGALAAAALLAAAPAAADCVNDCMWNCYQLTGRYGWGPPGSPQSRCIAACEYLNCPVPRGAFR